MRPGFVLADDDRLLDRGVLDSLGIVEMLSFLEDEFGVRTSDDEISESNLGSVSAIARFVVAKHGAAAA